MFFKAINNYFIFYWYLFTKTFIVVWISLTCGIILGVITHFKLTKRLCSNFPPPLFHSHRFRNQPGNGGSITAPPLFQLSLQSLNGLLHWPVLLFFLLVFLLPLLRGQLQVHCDSVSNGLGSNWRDGGGEGRRSGKEGWGEARCRKWQKRERRRE